MKQRPNNWYDAERANRNVNTSAQRQTDRWERGTDISTHKQIQVEKHKASYINSTISGTEKL